MAVLVPDACNDNVKQQASEHKDDGGQGRQDDGMRGIDSKSVHMHAFPLLRRSDEWQHAAPSPEVAAAQASIRRARHLVFIYRQRLDDMAAMLNGFLEQRWPGPVLFRRCRPFGQPHAQLPQQLLAVDRL
jgi:hypothetical protein